MSIISNTSKLKNYILIISFSLIFTEFYFFNWKTQFFVSNAYYLVQCKYRINYKKL